MLCRYLDAAIVCAWSCCVCSILHGKSWLIMKLIWIAKADSQQQIINKDKHNAHQHRSTSLVIPHLYGCIARWTSPLCPPLPLCPHPHLAVPDCWSRTTCWDTTWNYWGNLFMRLLIHKSFKNIPYIMWILFFTGLIWLYTHFAIHVTRFLTLFAT